MCVLRDLANSTVLEESVVNNDNVLSLRQHPKGDSQSRVFGLSNKVIDYADFSPATALGSRRVSS